MFCTYLRTNSVYLPLHHSLYGVLTVRYELIPFVWLVFVLKVFMDSIEIQFQFHSI